jgi:hypothetical protein
MGSSIEVEPGASRDESLFVAVLAPDPLERVELIRSGSVVDAISLKGEREVELESRVEGLREGEYVYVRVLQRNGGAAWSSPIFLE